MERRARVTALLAVLAAGAGCGDAERDAGAPPPAVAPVAPVVESPKAAPRPEREVITDDQAAEHAANALERRDTPLEVGAPAPRFDGYPEKTKAVLVFLRGEW